YPASDRALVLDTSRSAFNYPRAEVAWDLDGDGKFERRTGTRTTLTLPAGSPKPTRVGVRIRTTEGKTFTDQRTLGSRAAPIFSRVSETTATQNIGSWVAGR